MDSIAYKNMMWYFFILIEIELYVKEWHFGRWNYDTKDDFIAKTKIFQHYAKKYIASL